MRIFLMVFAAVALLCGLLFVLFFEIAPGLEGTIVDSKGNPLSGCFIVYDYRIDGGGFDPRPGSIVKTDSKGHFHVRRKMMSKFFVFAVHPKIWVYGIHSPKTHTAKWLLDGSIDGVVDPTLKEKKIVFHDLTDSPSEWFAALEALEKTLLAIYNREIALGDCEKEKAELFQSCTNEIASFRSRYRNAPYRTEWLIFQRKP